MNSMRFLTLLAVGTTGAMVSGAATLYWDGDATTVNSASDNTSAAAMNWLSGGNWDNGTTSAPKVTWTASDSAVFGGTPAGTQTVTLVNAASVGALTVGNGYKISITGTSYNQLGNPSGAITLAAGATLSADAASNNAHNIGTLNLNGGTLTSVNGPAGLANDGGYGNWILNAAGSGVFVGGASMSTISCSTIDVGAKTFTVSDATGTAATDLLVSGRIFKGALTKAGAGTMEITGANTYTGATTINAGGGTLLVSGSAGTLGSGAITVGAGGTLAFNTSGNRTIAANISGAGAVTRQTTSGGRYYLTGNNSGFTGVFTQVSGGTGDLRFDSVSAGSAAAQWVMNGPWMVFLLGTNTLELGALSGSANTWNDSTTGTTTLSVGALGLDTTYSGNMGQGFGAVTALTKTGAGKLTLSGGSVYSGATLITGGTLALGAGGSINNSASITVGGGAVFDVSAVAFTLGSGKILTGTGSVNGSLAVASGGILTPGTSGSGTLTASNNLTFNGTGTINIGALANYTATPALAVAGNLVLNGAAGAVTVNLPTAPLSNGTYHLISHGNVLADLSKFTFAGGPPLGARQSGTYQNNASMIDFVVAGDAPRWTGDASSEWSTATLSEPKNWKLITAGTTTDYIAGDTVLFNDSATGSTTVDIAADVSPTSTVFDNTTKNYTLQGAAGISSGTLIKNGSGALTLKNANTYAGGTTLSAGTVNVNNAGALGATASALTIAGGITLDNTSGAPIILANNNPQGWNADFTFTGSNDLNLGTGAVTLGGNRQVTVAAGTLAVGGVVGGGFSLTKAGAGKLTLTGVNSYSGATSINEGTLEIAGAGQLGSGTYAPNIANHGTLHINSSANQTLSGVISGAAGVLVKSGAGTLTLTNTNTYGGGTTLTPNGGTVLVSGGSATLGGGHISVGAGSTLAFNTTGVHRTLPGNISGGGTINKGGTWRYHLSGNNSGFSGTYTQTGGDTSFTSATAGSAAARWELGGAWMVFNLPTSGTLHFGALSGGAPTWNDSATSATTLEVGALGIDTTYTGSIGQGYGGVTALTKTGAGMLTLTGPNGYGGPTNINQGALLINGTHTGAGLITASAGATLGGTGTMVNVEIADGGILSPGSSAGTITIGTLTLNADSLVNLELGNPSVAGASDRVVVTSYFDDFGGLLNVSGLPGLGTPAPGASWLVIDYSLASGSVNSGANLAVGTNTTGLDLALDITTNPGQVLLVVVPEPAAGALFALALVLLLRRPLRS